MGGRRNTIQQEIVFQTLCGLHNHPTADEVYKEVYQQRSTISRATVFRILGKLAEEGRILRVPSGRGGDKFDADTQEHCHIRCRSCGRIDDILMKTSPRPEDEIEDLCGYSVTGCHILFQGICAACRNRSLQKQKSAETEVQRNRSLKEQQCEETEYN